MPITAGGHRHKSWPAATGAMKISTTLWDGAMMKTTPSQIIVVFRKSGESGAENGFIIRVMSKKKHLDTTFASIS